MPYIKQPWNQYDDTKSVEANIANNAVITPSKMKHIEDGIVLVQTEMNNENEEFVQEVNGEISKVTAQLAQTGTNISKKIGDGVQAQMGDLSQEIKTAMSGGSVAVVGEGAVGMVNLANDVKNDLQRKDANMVSVINEIPNGNFATTNHWAPVAGTLVVNSSEGEYTLTGISATARLDYTLKNSIAGHVYYLLGSILPKHSNPTTIRFGGSAVFSNPTPNVWNKISVQIKATSSDILRFYHDTSTEYVVGDKIKFRNIMVIDLTLAFGVGKEPSMDEFEFLLSYLPAWFQNVYNPNQTTVYKWNRDTSKKEIEKMKEEVSSGIGKKLTGKKLLTMGDSISANGTYQQTISKVTGATIVNNSFAGAKYSITNNTTYDPHSLYTLSSTVDLTDINHIWIMFGTNDFNNGLQLGIATEKISTTVRGALYASLENLLIRKPTLKIFISTPIWGGTKDDTGFQDLDTTKNQAGLYFREYVEAIEEVCRTFRIPCFDGQYECGINKFNYTTYLNDYLHPNAIGHEMIGSRFGNFINQYV